MNLKKYAIQSGKSLKEVEGAYKVALEEAGKLGVSNDNTFVEETLKIILEIDVENRPETVRKLNDEFLKSGKTNFSEFIRDRLDELNMSPVSSIGYINQTPTDNPIAVIPMPPTKKKTKKDEPYVKQPVDAAGKVDVGVTGIDELPDSEEEKAADKMGFDTKTKSVKDIKKGK